MKKTIYHGSEHLIETPVFGLGKRYNDYGLGFYCTEIENMAKEWAVGRRKDGYANKYEIDCSGLEIFNLNEDSYCMLHWLTILLQNREFEISSPLALEAKEYLMNHFRIDYEDADIITGYRADDSYFSFAQDFLNGTISYRQLCNAMKLGNLGQQIVIKSRRAFERLVFCGAEPVFAEEWYTKRSQRDKDARREYLDLERYRRKPGDLYVIQIIDERMEADDVRLR